MKKYIIIVMLALCACTDPNGAERALDDAGYSDIRIEGYGWFSCSREDGFRTRFTAKNPKGKTISGTVCSGVLFKNSTIRFD